MTITDKVKSWLLRRQYTKVQKKRAKITSLPWEPQNRQMPQQLC